METNQIVNDLPLPFFAKGIFTLDKSGDTEDGWKIRGLASTEDRDLEGEIVKQKGLDISPIKEGRGWINFNHSQDPEDIVGKLTDGRIGKEGLEIEGYLFKKHKRAQAIYSILRSLDEKDRHSIKYSIEGDVQQRAGRNKDIVTAAVVNKVSITFDPINTNTYVELVKSLKAMNKKQEVLEKATPVPDIAKTDPEGPGVQGPGDDNQANSAGEIDEVQEHLNMDNGLDKPGAPYDDHAVKPEKDVRELLKEIKELLQTMTTVMVVGKEEKVAKAKSSNEDLLKAKIKEQIKKKAKENNIKLVS